MGQPSLATRLSNLLMSEDSHPRVSSYKVLRERLLTAVCRLCVHPSQVTGGRKRGFTTWLPVQQTVPVSTEGNPGAGRVTVCGADGLAEERAPFCRRQWGSLRNFLSRKLQFTDFFFYFLFFCYRCSVPRFHELLTTLSSKIVLTERT